MVFGAMKITIVMFPFAGMMCGVYKEGKYICSVKFGEFDHIFSTFQLLGVEIDLEYEYKSLSHEYTNTFTEEQHLKWMNQNFGEVMPTLDNLPLQDMKKPQGNFDVRKV
jgi:hypothetical protein